MSRDSIGHTFRVAILLCVVCSVLVSGAAVGLREQQQANRERERKLNILAAADLDGEARRLGVEEVYRQRIVERIFDVEGGEFAAEIDPAGFDQRRAARGAELSVRIPGAIDYARIRQRERYSFAYLIQDEEGQVDQIVLPIRGYGLWSTLWGFLSLDAKSIGEAPEEITIRGITYYEHGETPGLGDQVDRKSWKEQWQEKRLYDQNWNVRMRVTKGTVDPRDAEAHFKVDGLSGATITANGVTNMIRYWFGEHGFRPFLQNAHQRPEVLTVQGASDG